MSVICTSFIPTGNATATRARDQLSFPFTAIPQAMTVYWSGWYNTPAALASFTPRIWQIGAAGSVAPRIAALAGATGFVGLYQNAVGVATIVTPGAGAFTTPAFVEVRLTLSAAGLVVIGQSVNGAAETTASAATAGTLPQAWSANLLWYNSIATANVSNSGVRDILFSRGVQTLATMRRLAGTLVR